MELFGELAPSVVVGTAALAALYFWAAHRLGRRPRRRQVAAFVCALLVMFLALTGPLDELEDARLFTAHMLQHLLLTLVVPPLLLAGLPDWMLRPVMLSRPVRPLAAFFTKPLVAFLSFALIFTLAHHPLFYDLMCRNEAVHITFHLLFLTTGVMLWWPLLSPMAEFPRLSYPMQILYLFLLMIPMTAVGAPITMDRNVVYPWYAEGPHPWGISPIEDQVLGGLLMWVGQGLYMICVFTAVFRKWAQHEDRDNPPAERTTADVRILRPVRKPGV